MSADNKVDRSLCYECRQAIYAYLGLSTYESIPINIYHGTSEPCLTGSPGGKAYRKTLLIPYGEMSVVPNGAPSQSVNDTRSIYVGLTWVNTYKPIESIEAYMASVKGIIDQITEWRKEQGTPPDKAKVMSL